MSLPTNSPSASPTSAPPRSRRVIAWAFHPREGVHKHIPPEEISERLADKESLLWLDITDPQAKDMALLEEEFGIHSLALEEVVLPHTRPKCSEFPGFYVMVMYAAALQNHHVDLREVIIYIGQRFLITAHREPLPEVEECVRRWRANQALHSDTIAAPLYSLLDTLVDGYFPVIDQIAEDVEALEDRIFSGDAAPHGPHIFGLKKDMLALRRAVVGQRDALNLVLRQDVTLLPDESLLYFQSVYDHLVRLVESIDTYRDLLSSAMDMHLSVLSNRMNQVMKTLTAISTILMSVTLIAGIYGMNFKNMPELHLRYGYYGALGVMIVIAVSLIAFFRRIKWF